MSRRQVEAMAAYGLPELNIAEIVGIDPKTLRKHYRHELDNGQVKATAKVAESLFRKATSNGPQSVTTAIFWLKTKGGWREAPQVHEVGLFDLNRVTDQELEWILELTRTAIAKNGPDLRRIAARFCTQSPCGQWGLVIQGFRFGEALRWHDLI
jgi:hypothetical protein